MDILAGFLPPTLGETCLLIYVDVLRKVVNFFSSFAILDLYMYSFSFLVKGPPSASGEGEVRFDEPRLDRNTLSAGGDFNILDELPLADGVDLG